MRLLRLGVLPFCLGFGGCAYQLNDVADPSNISLRDAVFNVEDTMYDAMLRARNRPKVGMYLDEATVVFNVSAKQVEEGKLSVSPAIPQVPIGLSASNTSTGEANRGNTITLVFKNVGKKVVMFKPAKADAKPDAKPDAKSDAKSDVGKSDAAKNDARGGGGGGEVIFDKKNPRQ
jgi:hypothetical protein